MSKSNAFENDLLKLIFNAGAIADLADNDATAPLTALFLGLHTSDPGEAGDQLTGEMAYTGYVRVSTARTTAGFTVTGATVTFAADRDFPKMTGGAGGTVTHFSVGTAATGAGKILYRGACSPNILIQTGVVPRLEQSTSITED